MQSLLDYIYDYRLKDGSDPSKLFHRKVNKRMLPDYYDVIKEPMAMSTIKAKINTKEYRNIKDFVRDWALISFNAQVYNIPLSKAYVDAVEIRRIVNTELGKFVEDGVLTKEEAEMPYLGEIPVAEDMPMIEGDVEDEEVDAEGSADEEEEDDEDDDLDDSDDEGGRRKKRKSTKPGLKRLASKYKEVDDDEGDARKRRGRPPRVDTPLESRIKEILKGMRKFKSTSGSLMIYSFERLPDKSELPDYYTEVRNPIALDTIKKKLKRKKYSSVDAFMVDLELMFENAKSYNTDESQVYKEAVHLQKETRKIAEEVKMKPDTDYASEDGRIPMPDGILHNGELWKVGMFDSSLPLLVACMVY
jgi:chromatin structure-remodeling complex subunit RSC1/2